MASIEYHKKIKDMYGVPDVRVKEPQRLLLTAISRVTAWRMEKEGLFPKRKRMSSNHVTWSMAEIMEWLDEQKEKRATE